MLSESAQQLDGLLRLTRTTTSCADCVALSLDVEKWDAMKLIRELILAGDVTCIVSECSTCESHTLVARIRPARWR